MSMLEQTATEARTRSFSWEDPAASAAPGQLA